MMIKTVSSVFPVLFCGLFFVLDNNNRISAEHSEKENTDNNPYEYHIGGVLSSNNSESFFKQTIEHLNFNTPFMKPGNTFYAHSIKMDPNPIKTALNVCKQLIVRRVYAVIVSHPQIGDLSPAAVSYTSGFYHIPVIGISSRDSAFSDKNIHVSFLRTVPPYSHQAEVWVELLKYFNYLKVIFIHSSDTDGRAFVGRFQTTSQNQGEDIEKKVQVESVIEFEPGLIHFNNQLNEMKNAQARVYLMYASKIDAEVIFRNAASRNMTEAGYVWIVTEQALDAVNVPEGTIGLKLVNASNEFAHIYDSIYILASAISDMNRTKTITQPPADCDNSGSIWETGRTLFEYIKKQVYKDGHTGKVAFDNNGDRIYAEYDIVNVKQVTNKDAIGKYYFDNELNKMKLRLNESNIIWPGRLTKKPEGFMIPTHLKVLTIEEKPFVYIRPLKKDNGNSCESDEIMCPLYNTSTKEPKVYCCKGYCIDLLVELSKTINFTYSLSLSPDGQFGNYEIRNRSVSGKKEWNGLIGELVYERADMILAPLTINPERAEFIEFSKPFKYQGITILEKKPSRSSTLVSFLQPFSHTLWVLVMGSVHVVALVLYLLDRFSPFARFKLINADGTEEDALNLSSATWFAWGVLLNSGIGEGTPRSFSARVLGMVWAGFAMIIVASYTANLAAFLVLERPKTKLSGINDARLRSTMENLTCATVKGSAVDMYFRRQVELSNMYRTMEANNYETAEEAIRDVKNDKLMAFIWDSSRLEFEAAQDCQLVTAGELFGRSGYGIGLQKGSPWSESVTLSILDFHESGFMESLDDKWIFQGRVEQCEDQEKTPNTLGLKNMAGVFILVAVGIVVGMVLIVIEIGYKKHHVRKQNRLQLARNYGQTWRAIVQKNNKKMQPVNFDDRLRFHLHCGTLVKLSPNNRTAKRLRAFDEFNNGVVMTNRNLNDDELFEIRIDKLVDKWSGSVEVGVTVHDPGAIPIPSTMTNMRTGTSMMSGRGILANGKGIRREYGNFNLDDLKVGDRIGLMRKRNGDLHYYINSLDQGVAVSNLPPKVWGVVDMYGRTVKVTIVDRDINEEKNLLTRLSNSLTMSNENPLLDEDLLEFHPMCGAHTLVINNNTVAYRPNALDDFNNGVVLTKRPLRSNELFEVRLDRLITKWAGSIEIGVTTHRPGDIDYPLTMTNVHSGTWMMTGVGIMHNGITVVNQYGVNLDTLRVGDRVGAMIKSDGTLHFFVNGVDQGEAAKNVPVGVYGVVDLYGQAAQITICRDNVDQISPYKNNVRFFPNHGKNARVVPGSRGRTADRLYSEYEFSQSIVLVNQTLQDGELFAVSVDRLNDRWSGSIEVGVTTIPPNVLSIDLPNTMTDLDHDTWVLSGCTIMKDGIAVKYDYPLDLDKIKVGSVVGIMRHDNGCLSYFLDGKDQGIACINVPSNLYPLIDIYGRCTQVTIQSPPEIRCDESDSDTSCCSQDDAISIQTETGTKGQKYINLSEYLHGINIRLIEENRTAIRIKSYKGGLIICDNKMVPNELFQILIVQCNTNYAGSLRIGIISSLPKTPLPPSIKDLNGNRDIWYFSGNKVWNNQSLIMSNYCPSLDRLREGDRIGIKYTGDRTLHLYVNGYDQGTAIYNLPEVVYGVIDLYGCHISAKVIHNDQDSKTNAQMMSSQCSDNLSDVSESVKVDTTINVLKRMTVLDEDMSECCSSEMSCFIDESTYKLMRFNDWRGRNVRLSRDGRTATRTDSYNHGLLMTSDILLPNTIFQVVIQSLNKKWDSSIMIGVSKITCSNNTAPATALSLKGYDSTWIISGDSVYFDGLKIKSNYGPDLNYCLPGDIIGIMIDGENNLKLFVNRIDYGIAAINMPADCYGIVDLYGQCEQVSIVNPFIDMSPVELGPNMPLECDLLPEDTSQQIPSEEKADLEGDEKQSPACEESELADLTWMKTDKTNENVLVASGHDVRSRSAELAGWIDEEASTSTLRVSKMRTGKTSSYYTPDTRERRQHDILKSLRLKQCQYFNLSLKIRTYLSIPDEFFLDLGHTCYCDGCNLYTRDENKLSIEAGWCKFSLRKHPKFNNLTLDKWRSAYVGKSFDMIRKCLDSGTLVTHDDSESENIILYPYLKRTVCCQNIKPFKFYDLAANNQYKCHAAFEVMIELGSFEIGELLPKSSKTDYQSSSLVIPKMGTKSILTAIYFRFDRDIN